MDVSRFARASPAQQQDILKIAQALSISPTDIVDGFRLSPRQWVVWFEHRVEPQIFYTGEGELGLYTVDPEEALLIAQLQWWVEVSGQRPGKGHARTTIAGIEIEVMLTSRGGYDYYTLSWCVVGNARWVPREIPICLVLEPEYDGHPSCADPARWIAHEIALFCQQGAA